MGLIGDGSNIWLKLLFLWLVMETFIPCHGNLSPTLHAVCAVKSYATVNKNQLDLMMIKWEKFNSSLLMLRFSHNFEFKSLKI